MRSMVSCHTETFSETDSWLSLYPQIVLISLFSCFFSPPRVCKLHRLMLCFVKSDGKLTICSLQLPVNIRLVTYSTRRSATSGEFLQALNWFGGLDLHLRCIHLYKSANQVSYPSRSNHLGSFCDLCTNTIILSAYLYYIWHTLFSKMYSTKNSRWLSKGDL